MECLPICRKADLVACSLKLAKRKKLFIDKVVSQEKASDNRKINGDPENNPQQVLKSLELGSSPGPLYRIRYEFYIQLADNSLLAILFILFF